MYCNHMLLYLVLDQGGTLFWQLSNTVSLCMYQTPNTKGEEESGTVSYTAIYSLWNHEFEWMSAT